MEILAESVLFDLEFGGTEIDKQPMLDFGRLQVTKHLRDVFIRQGSARRAA